MKPRDIESAGRVYGKRFSDWLGFVLQWEVEYDGEGNIRTENVSGDRGGLTFAGIDQASHPTFDYANPSAAEVARIFHDDYWNQVCSDTLGFPVGEVVANFAVNMGKKAAVKLLQQAVNTLPAGPSVTVDGVLGPKTIGAAIDEKPESLADLIEDAADSRYRSIVENNPGQRKFLKGWLNRDDALERWWMNLKR